MSAMRCQECGYYGNPYGPITIQQIRRADSLIDQPWPLRDVVRKLCEAAEILLHEKNYDGHGYEEISHALKVGREWVLGK